MSLKPIQTYGVLAIMGALSITTQNLAHAGRDTGNGGVGIVCRNPRGNILSVEMLDIYEGRIQNSLTYAAEPTDTDVRIGMTEPKMISNPSFLREFQNELARVRAGWIFLPRGTGLEPTNDAFPVINRRGCAFEQVANYTDEGQIYVDRELFSQMDSLNQAALYLHEAIYKLARNQVQETTSIRTRRIVAHLLARNGDSAVIAELMRQLSTPPAPPAPPTPPSRLQLWAGRWTDGVETSGWCDNSITTDPTNNQLIFVGINTVIKPCSRAGDTSVYQCNPTGDSCTNSNGVNVRLIDENTHLLTWRSGRQALFRKY